MDFMSPTLKEVAGDLLDEDIEGLSEYYLRNIDEIDAAQLRNPNEIFASSMFI